MWDLIVSVPDHCLSFYLSPPIFFTVFSKAVLLLWFIFICYHIYNVCLLLIIAYHFTVGIIHTCTALRYKPAFIATW